MQINYINPNEQLGNLLKTHSMHFFEGNYISVFTAIFLHGSIAHLLSNLLALLVFGRIVEKKLGTKINFKKNYCEIIGLGLNSFNYKKNLEVDMMLANYDVGNYIILYGSLY